MTYNSDCSVYTGTLLKCSNFWGVVGVLQSRYILTISLFREACEDITGGSMALKDETADDASEKDEFVLANEPTEEKSAGHVLAKGTYSIVGNLLVTCKTTRTALHFRIE